MAWVLDIVVQQRGNKNESIERVRFESEATGKAASERLRADVEKAAPEQFVIVTSPKSEISFLKQDFRRTHLYEYNPRRSAGVVV